MIVGNMVGGMPMTKSFILETPDGKEIPAVLTDREVVFTATANDIREGKVAATGTGVTLGEKVIPAYHTHEGCMIIKPGRKFAIPLKNLELYKYTKFQAIICPLHNTPEESVAAEKVSIDGKVYETKSSASISIVIANDTEQSIDLGISNETDNPSVLRYITYKEIE